MAEYLKTAGAVNGGVSLEVRVLLVLLLEVC